MKNEITQIVQDRTPVGGDKTAIQSYLDLSLNRDDIIEAIITKDCEETENKIEKLNEQITENEKRKKRDKRKK